MGQGRRQKGSDSGSIGQRLRKGGKALHTSLKDLFGKGTVAEQVKKFSPQPSAIEESKQGSEIETELAELKKRELVNAQHIDEKIDIVDPVRKARQMSLDQLREKGLVSAQFIVNFLKDFFSKPENQNKNILEILNNSKTNFKKIEEIFNPVSKLNLNEDQKKLLEILKTTCKFEKDELVSVDYQEFCHKIANSYGREWFLENILIPDLEEGIKEITSLDFVNNKLDNFKNTKSFYVILDGEISDRNKIYADLISFEVAKRYSKEFGTSLVSSEDLNESQKNKIEAAFEKQQKILKAPQEAEEKALEEREMEEKRKEEKIKIEEKTSIDELQKLKEQVDGILKDGNFSQILAIKAQWVDGVQECSLYDFAEVLIYWIDEDISAKKMDRLRKIGEFVTVFLNNHLEVKRLFKEIETEKQHIDEFIKTNISLNVDISDKDMLINELTSSIPVRPSDETFKSLRDYFFNLRNYRVYLKNFDDFYKEYLEAYKLAESSKTNFSDPKPMNEIIVSLYILLLEVVQNRKISDEDDLNLLALTEKIKLFLENKAVIDMACEYIKKGINKDINKERNFLERICRLDSNKTDEMLNILDDAQSRRIIIPSNDPFFPRIIQAIELFRQSEPNGVDRIIAAAGERLYFLNDCNDAGQLIVDIMSQSVDDVVLTNFIRAAEEKNENADVLDVFSRTIRGIGVEEVSVSDKTISDIYNDPILKKSILDERIITATKTQLSLINTKNKLIVAINRTIDVDGILNNLRNLTDIDNTISRIQGESPALHLDSKLVKTVIESDLFKLEIYVVVDERIEFLDIVNKIIAGINESRSQKDLAIIVDLSDSDHAAEFFAAINRITSPSVFLLDVIQAEDILDDNNLRVQEKIIAAARDRLNFLNKETHQFVANKIKKVVDEAVLEEDNLTGFRQGIKNDIDINEGAVSKEMVDYNFSMVALKLNITRAAHDQVELIQNSNQIIEAVKQCNDDIDGLNNIKQAITNQSLNVFRAALLRLNNLFPEDFLQTSQKAFALSVDGLYPFREVILKAVDAKIAEIESVNKIIDEINNCHSIKELSDIRENIKNVENILTDEELKGKINNAFEKKLAAEASQVIMERISKLGEKNALEVLEELILAIDGDAFSKAILNIKVPVHPKILEIFKNDPAFQKAVKNKAAEQLAAIEFIEKIGKSGDLSFLETTASQFRMNPNDPLSVKIRAAADKRTAAIITTEEIIKSIKKSLDLDNLTKIVNSEDDSRDFIDSVKIHTDLQLPVLVLVLGSIFDNNDLKEKIINAANDQANLFKIKDQIITEVNRSFNKEILKAISSGRDIDMYLDIICENKIQDKHINDVVNFKLDDGVSYPFRVEIIQAVDARIALFNIVDQIINEINKSRSEDGLKQIGELAYNYFDRKFSKVISKSWSVPLSEKQAFDILHDEGLLTNIYYAAAHRYYALIKKDELIDVIEESNDIEKLNNILEANSKGKFVAAISVFNILKNDDESFFSEKGHKPTTDEITFERISNKYLDLRDDIIDATRARFDELTDIVTDQLLKQLKILDVPVDYIFQNRAEAAVFIENIAEILKMTPEQVKEIIDNLKPAQLEKIQKYEAAKNMPIAQLTEMVDRFIYRVERAEEVLAEYESDKHRLINDDVKNDIKILEQIKKSDIIEDKVNIMEILEKHIDLFNPYIPFSSPFVDDVFQKNMQMLYDRLLTAHFDPATYNKDDWSHLEEWSKKIPDFVALLKDQFKSLPSTEKTDDHQILKKIRDFQRLQFLMQERREAPFMDHPNRYKNPIDIPKEKFDEYCEKDEKNIYLSAKDELADGKLESPKPGENKITIHAREDESTFAVEHHKPNGGFKFEIWDLSAELSDHELFKQYIKEKFVKKFKLSADKQIEISNKIDQLPKILKKDDVAAFIQMQVFPPDRELKWLQFSSAEEHAENFTKRFLPLCRMVVVSVWGPVIMPNDAMFAEAARVISLLKERGIFPIKITSGCPELLLALELLIYQHDLNCQTHERLKKKILLPAKLATKAQLAEMEKEDSRDVRTPTYLNLRQKSSDGSRKIFIPSDRDANKWVTDDLINQISAYGETHLAEIKKEPSIGRGPRPGLGTAAGAA